MRKVLPLLAFAFALAGCVNLGEQRNTPAVVYYVLNDTLPVTSPTPGVRDGKPILLVPDTAAGGFNDTDQLIFSHSADTRGQYQFARWTERPGKRFADLIRTRLDRQGLWNVSAAGGYVRGNLLLDTELVDFYHDASSNPGRVRLNLRAELVDLKQRTLLGRRVFEQDVPLTTFDAAGAAQASSLAASRMLDDLAVWLATFR